MREQYADYLRSEEWALRRDLVMQRAGGRCEGCGLAKATEVHHRTYEHVTQEFLFELVALCGDCHGRIHETPSLRQSSPRRPGNPETRHQLAQLGAIHRRQWMTLTTEQQQERQKAILRGETLPPPPDDVPEAMEAE